MRTIPLAAILLLAVNACSGEQGRPGANGRSQLLGTTTEAPGSHCASGGIKVETGTDDNGNQALEATEVDSTVYVCDGAAGQQVAATPEAPGSNCPQGGVKVTPAGGTPTYVCNGAPGAPGQAGTSVTLVPEPPGANCGLGGTKLQVGPNAPTFVCHGATGAPGAPGQDGASVSVTPEPPGTDCAFGGARFQVGSGAPTFVCTGATGATGQDGASVTMTPEPPGASCPLGGVRLQVGAGAPTFVCDGATGAPGAPGQDGASVSVTPEPPGGSCLFGGARLQVGTGSPTFVCNGAAGAPGAPGSNGLDGASVTMTSEPPGANCPLGGVKLQVGAGAPTFVCDGATGAPGAPGQDGASVSVTPEPPGGSCLFGGARLQVGTGSPTFVCNGAAGAPGSNGQDGASVTVTPEPPSANCLLGGVKLQVGAGAPTFVCNGATGAPGAPGQDGASVSVTPEPPGTSCLYGGARLQVGSGAPAFACNGAPGSNGQDGASVTMTPEPPGANCLLGGVKLQVGAGAPTFVCNGATGAPGTPGQDGASVTMTPEPPGTNCGLGGVRLQVGAGPVSYLCSGAPPGTSLPTVATLGVSDVRYTAATVDADVTDDGSELIFARGVVLAAHPGPGLHDAVYYANPGTGAFATRCDLLAPDTAYWVRPFATNALGTSFGEERSFTTRALTVPTLSTQAVSTVTDSTATSGGDITDDGGTPILSRGACWSPAPDPTTASACVSEGVGAGGYLVLLTGLPSGTALHVRAFASNAQGTSYGEDRSFTTVTLPLATVTTSAPTAISYTTASGGGTVVSDHGAPVTGRGICWATTPGPTRAGTCFTEAGGLGTFSAGLTGLAAGTTYYVRAWALNGGGTSYGNEVTFATLATSVPALTTRAVIGVSSDVAGSGGVISTDGGSPVTARGVCWSINPGPTIANTRTTDGTGSAAFSSTMTGLNPLTTYYVRAYATNALGTAYGSELSFTTTDLVTPGPTLPVVGTSTSTITGSTTAASGGYVSNDGGSAITARGVCWSTNQNPTLADSCSSGGAGIGYFSATVTGLGGCGVVYYVRAYATNATGTAYGNQNSVSTGLLPTVTTAPASAIGSYEATSGGAITDNGGCAITQKGVVWNWAPSPVLGNPATTQGGGDAPFVSSVTPLQANRTYYARAYATNSVGTAYGPQVVFTTAEPSTPYVGQSYAGGIVFHVDGSGLHGLVVAPADQGYFQWGCQNTGISTSAAIGSGATNTAAIVASCGEASFAAKAADSLSLGGYTDWFLPSTGELGLVRSNLYLQGLGGFGASLYWTSTETNPWSAFATYLPNGDNWNMGKSDTRAVRAVRAF